MKFCMRLLAVVDFVCQSVYGSDPVGVHREVYIYLSSIRRHAMTRQFWARIVLALARVIVSVLGGGESRRGSEQSDPSKGKA